MARADRIVLAVPANVFKKFIPQDSSQNISGSPFRVTSVPAEKLDLLTSAQGIQTFSTAELAAVGWPGTADLWTYGGRASGNIQVGARVAADKSLHIRISGDVDTDQGAKTGLRGRIYYDGSCDPRRVLVFSGASRDAIGSPVYVIAYRITELNPTRTVSPTLGIVAQ